ncbi:hypothetical protein DXG01_012046 [Tephrocybe rancida]|nr:hypothetical protein DXG01_012046 [Tephrocybe rancida]
MFSRDDVFQANLYDFQDEFFKKEKARCVRERARVEDFNQRVANLEVAFSANSCRQEDVYMKVDAHQEAIYKASEVVRERPFSPTDGRRVETFGSGRELRLKGSEWHSSAREMLIQKARRKWGETYAVLDASLMDQFTVLLSCPEEEFLSERRRDGLVEKLVVGRKEAGESWKPRAQQDGSNTPYDTERISASFTLPHGANGSSAGVPKSKFK